jgi:hypothetical protein
MAAPVPKILDTTSYMTLLPYAYDQSNYPLHPSPAQISNILNYIFEMFNFQYHKKLLFRADGKEI